jgi:hypothetical protein
MGFSFALPQMLHVKFLYFQKEEEEDSIIDFECRDDSAFFGVFACEKRIESLRRIYLARAIEVCTQRRRGLDQEGGGI